MIRAVIFDFDGVIGDTMEDNFSAWKNAFLQFKVEIEQIDYLLLEGMGRFQIVEELIKKYKVQNADKVVIVENKENYYESNNSFKLYPQVINILDYLITKKVPLGLVTGSSRKRIYHTIDDLIRKFNIIITADDVRKSKPDPLPYLMAIKHLGIPSYECLVVENAKLGIKSAKAAGCKCFAIETTLSRKFLADADEIFKSHDDLITRFQEIF